MAEPEVSEEAIALMEHLLAVHYIVGGVPMPIVELVEETLRRVGRWFPDPQGGFYDPEQGYM
jgi:hypothetical protein